MKTVLEQLIEVQNQLDELKLHMRNKESFEAETESTEFEPCCSDNYCGCGCDEPEVETEMPSEFDSAGFSVEDREPEPKIEFTREQLITFATKLAERMMDKCKEAVTDTNLNADDLVDLSLGYGFQIDVELDQDAIVRSIHDEIDGTIKLDVDSVEDEVKDILDDMDMIQKN